MRVVLICSLFGLIVGATLTAAAKDPADYPLRVQIADVHWQNANGGASGYGHGNVQNGESWRGFTFTFQCGRPFMVSNDNTSYLAKWKKPDTRLAILTVQIGNTEKHDECELKTTVTDAIYGNRAGQLVTYTPQQFAAMQSAQRLLQQEAHPTDTDPAHYPLKVILLEATWQNGPVTGAVSGSGRGNVRAASTTAFDFSAMCPGRLGPSAPGTAYQARWLAEPTRLVVLAHVTGEAQTAHVCELKVEQRPNYVYVRNDATGVVSAVTATEFAARNSGRSNNAGAPTPPVSPASATPARQPSKVLTNADVLAMVSAGVSAEVILAKMGASDCAFDTSADGLRQLKAGRVPDGVVMEMIKHK
jgi:hypothetical protein